MFNWQISSLVYRTTPETKNNEKKLKTEHPESVKAVLLVATLTDQYFVTVATVKW